MSSLTALPVDVDFQENTALHALNLTYILKEIPPMSFVKIAEIYREKLVINSAHNCTTRFKHYCHRKLIITI